MKDMTYRAGFGAKYMLNRNFYASVNYDYSQKESDLTGGGDSDYKQSIVSIRLEIQL